LGIYTESEGRSRRIRFRNNGMLEEWNDGGKEIPPGLPFTKGRRPIGILEGWKTEGINANREPANARDGF